MKRISLLIILLVAVVFSGASCVGRRVGATIPSSRAVIVDVGIFYDELAPYGRWFQLDDYGWVWTPSDISYGWRPYTNGYWVFTDYGWTWVSNWRWGWAPFHYGRWFHHAHHGWVWLPGTVWGPAWVAWRHGPGWVGWAPLPPRVGWEVGIGLNLRSVDLDREVEPFWYSFVEERYLLERNLNRHLELSARNVTLWRETQNATNYAAVENRVINRGLAVERIEQATGRPVLRHRIVDANSASRSTGVRGSDVEVFRPTISRSTTDRTPRSVELFRKPPTSSGDLQRRQDAERRSLETHQTRERATLEKQHRQEQSRPPSRVAPGDLQKRQETERRALEEQKRRETQVLQNRQEMQRKAQPPPSKPTPPPKKRKNER